MIGNGNVAIDVARMLVLDPEELAPTDTADHAIEALAKSNVKEVIVLGRRGPAQAAFTNPELRELGELERADVIVDPADLQLDAASEAWLECDEADATARKNVEILREYAQREPTGKSHRDRAALPRLAARDRRRRQGRGDRRSAATSSRPARAARCAPYATGESETIDCGLVLRSIGYRGEPLDDVPFEPQRGLIRNDGGRVCGEDEQPLAGEYCVGWIKRGPSGVIGTNKKDATDTVARIIEDRDAGKLDSPVRSTATRSSSSASACRASPAGEGWSLIDAHEQQLGEPQGRPRVKLTDVAAMSDIAAGAAQSV